MLTCSSSWLIAADRVLLRFKTPRPPPYALINLTYVFSLLRYFRFILICLGKSILFFSTDYSVEDLSEENVVYMSSLRLPLLDFLVSSVQFSVNNKDYRRDFHLLDAPSKLDNAKRSQMTDLRL